MGDTPDKDRGPEPRNPVFCDSCGKEITDPEDLVVWTTWILGGLQVSCVSCFGSLAKRRKYDSELHVILNNLGVVGIVVLSVFYGGIIALLIWFLYLAAQPSVQKSPGVELVLVLMLLVISGSYAKLMVQRWISWREFERPLRQQARRP